MEKKDKPLKQFAFWDAGEDEGYFNHFDEKEDAVSRGISQSEENAVEIFEVTYKSLGKFKLKTVLVKSKK